MGVGNFEKCTDSDCRSGFPTEMPHTEQGGMGHRFFLAPSVKGQ